jgi:MFS family permease
MEANDNRTPYLEYQEPQRRQALYRRTVAVVMLSQLLGGAGLTAGITMGALLAKEMLGSDALAGVPLMLFTLGSALTAMLVGRLSQRHGRRPALTLGFLAGAAGAVGVVWATIVGSVWLLLVSLFVYGAGSATSLQARYAGTDLASEQQRGTAVGMALVATTFGVMISPLLTDILSSLTTSLGASPSAGVFILAVVAYTLAALALLVFLRPDPLLVSLKVAGNGQGKGDAEKVASSVSTSKTAAERGDDASVADGGPIADDASVADGTPVADDASVAGGTPVTGDGPAADDGPVADDDSVTGDGPAFLTPHRRAERRGIVMGTVIVSVTFAVMAMVMTMTPVHMQYHGHDLARIGWVISVHIAAMYLPSLFSGMLVDRFGRRPIALASTVVLALAAVFAALARDGSLPLLIGALALLGVGWNLGMISGTAVIVDSAPLKRRARVQGQADVVLCLSNALAGVSSGLIVAGGDALNFLPANFGFSLLSLVSAAISLLLAAFIAVGLPRKIPPNPSTPKQ